MPCLINSQILKMISLVESLLYSVAPEEGWRIHWPKCASKYHNKDEDNSPKIQHNTL